MKHFTIILIFLLGPTTSLYAEQSMREEDENKKQFEIIDRLNEFIKEEQQNEDKVPAALILPEPSSIAMLDDSTKEKYFEALREHYKYCITGYQHRKEVFEWQLFSSKLIFIVVVILVFAGIYFSWVQFHSSLQGKATKDLREKSKITTEETETTEIVVSGKGIKVSSPILGVIILVISLLFFYLYLVHVYPIEEIL